MKKQYIKPFVQIDNIEDDFSILAGTQQPPASGIDNFIDETPTGLDPEVTGGDYGGDPPGFLEGD